MNKDKVVKQGIKTVEIAFKIRDIDFYELSDAFRDAVMDVYQGAIKDYEEFRREVNK